MPRNDPRRTALAVLSAATLMIILDGTIVTVALTSIQKSLRFSPTGLTWVVNAYMIAFGSLLLLAGRLGDLVGRKRMLQAGLGVFTVASLLAGAAVDPAMMIAARFLQGAGGAMVSAVALGMIVALYPEPDLRARALAVFSFVGAAGAAIGLIAGGLLTQFLNWHWIFLVNLPIGVATAAIAQKVLDRKPGEGLKAGVDVIGAVLVTAGLMAGIYAIVGNHLAGVPAFLLLAAFVVRQNRAAVPLLKLRVFASRNVSGVYVVQLLVIAAAWGFQVLVTMYLQSVLGYGAAESGLAFAPTAVVIGVTALKFSAKLISRFGARAVLMTGLTLIVTALLLLTQVPVHGAYAVHLLPALVVFGLGGGVTLPALATLGMADATEADAGVISGLFSTGQQLGGAIGVATLSALAASRTSTLAGTGHPVTSALTGGYHLAFGIGAALGAVSILLAAAILRGTKPTVGPAEPSESRGSTISLVA